MLWILLGVLALVTINSAHWWMDRFQGFVTDCLARVAAHVPAGWWGANPSRAWSVGIRQGAELLAADCGRGSGSVFSG